MNAPDTPPTRAELRTDRAYAAWRVKLWEERSAEAAKQLAEAQQELAAAEAALDAS